MVEIADFKKRWNMFWTSRIAGETLTFEDMERFMTRTSGKNLSNLMKGKKMEGYMEGAMDRMLTKGQKIAIGVIVTIIFVIIIVYIVLKNQGLIPM